MIPIYDVENDLADLQKQLRVIDLLVNKLKKAISTEEPSLSGNEGWELIRESNAVNFLIGRITRYYLRHPAIAPEKEHSKLLPIVHGDGKVVGKYFEMTPLQAHISQPDEHLESAFVERYDDTH